MTHLVTPGFLVFARNDNGFPTEGIRRGGFKSVLHCTEAIHGYKEKNSVARSHHSHSIHAFLMPDPAQPQPKRLFITRIPVKMNLDGVRLAYLYFF
jgi:hypothetical protein